MLNAEDTRLKQYTANKFVLEDLEEEIKKYNAFRMS
jgi:hypothetical protein